jgi:hypothetical protein
MKIEFHGSGTSSNPTSALVRPFRLLLDEGKPIGTINYVLFKGKTLRVLGTFNFTPGKRLLFFPGLIGRKPRWFTKGSFVKSANETEIIDHLTLEPDLRSYHTTVLGPSSSRSVLTSYRTINVKKNLTYWFGLSLQNEEMLEICPEEMVFRFMSPPQDTHRRANVVLESRRGAKFHITSLYPKSEFVDCYLHFDFIVDQSRFAASILTRFPELASLHGLPSGPTTAPTSPPLLKARVPIPSHAPVRGHPVSIPNFSGIVWVISFIHPGELSEQILIGGF